MKPVYNLETMIETARNAGLAVENRSNYVRIIRNQYSLGYEELALMPAECVVEYLSLTFQQSRKTFPGEMIAQNPGNVFLRELAQKTEEASRHGNAMVNLQHDCSSQEEMAEILYLFTGNGSGKQATLQ